MDTVSRRTLLETTMKLGGATALAATVPTRASAAVGESASSTSNGMGREEQRSLDELYAEALREGGKLVIYAGGDTPDQQDFTKQAFLSRFPGIDLKLIVDYSKYHDARVDNQLATRTLVPDVVQLQTLQDFVRWKDQGVLLEYKPAGFSAVHPKFKDPQGAWVAIAVYAFSYMHDARLGVTAPATPRDLVNIQWKGAIASSYPHDDDAVLYLYRLYAQAYGWNWIQQLATQEIQFNRGSHSPIVAVAFAQKRIGIGGAGSLTAPLAPGVQWSIPDGHPFMAWGQRAAILKRAAHPAAAKLYLNWQLSAPVQQFSFNGWSVRTDVLPQGNLRPIWEYRNANIDGFDKFMADRAEVERWKQTFALYFGEVQGPPTTGWLGLHPGR